LAELAIEGWVPCGVGDWAVALRSPEGSLVARVCPFDPAYWAFVDLCRQCAGNRWLPRIDLAASLEGGGSVVFLEYVAPVDHPVGKQFAERWRDRAADPEFQEVRRAARMIDAEYRNSTPWWGRCDLDDAHIFRAADDRPVLLDVYCMAGTDLYNAILEDVAEVHRRIPRERMRYALDIPYIARENSAAEILALKQAWTRVSLRRHRAVHAGGYGQAESDEDDAQDYGPPAEYQARERQAGPLFPGVPDLIPGHVAEHDRRDGRQRPNRELPEPAGEARYREPVGPGSDGHHGRRGGRRRPHGQVAQDMV
jgi:hypothetical protein